MNTTELMFKLLDAKEAEFDYDKPNLFKVVIATLPDEYDNVEYYSIDDDFDLSFIKSGIIVLHPKELISN